MSIFIFGKIKNREIRNSFYPIISPPVKCYVQESIFAGKALNLKAKRQRAENAHRLARRGRITS
jgi:hypothetical protein